MPAGAAATLREHPIGTGPVPVRPLRGRRPRRARRRSPTTSAGAPRNDGVVLQDRARRRDARPRAAQRARSTSSSTTLARHRPPARTGRRGCRRSTAPGVDYQYIGLNLRDPVLQRRARPPGAGATPSTGTRSSSTCAAVSRRRPTGCCRRSSWALRAGRRSRSRTIRRARARCSTRPAIPIPDGDGPAPRLPLTLKMSNNEFNRLQAAVIQQDLRARRHRARRAHLRVRDAVRRRPHGQLPAVSRCSGPAARSPIPTSCAACFTRRRCRRPASTAATSATRRSTRCSTRPRRRRPRRRRRRSSREVQRDPRREVPYISLWHKTNFAVAQRDLAGIHLSPIADFHVPQRCRARRHCRLTSAASSRLLAAATAVPRRPRFDPALRFRTLPTEHFVIYFHQGEERLAARLARIAEETWQPLQPALGVPMPPAHARRPRRSDGARQRLGDAAARTTRSSSTPAAPSGSEFIGNTDDWLRLVFTHEFTHIVHLDRSRGLGARSCAASSAGRRSRFRTCSCRPGRSKGSRPIEESALTGDGPAARRRLSRDRARSGADGAARAARSRQRRPDRLAGRSAPYAYGARLSRVPGGARGRDIRSAGGVDDAPPALFHGARAFSKVYGESLDDAVAGLSRTASTEACRSRPFGNRPAAHPPRLRCRGAAVSSTADVPGVRREIVYSARTPTASPPQRCVPRRLEAARDHHPLSRFDERGRPRADCFRSAGSRRGWSVSTATCMLSTSRTRDVTQLTDGERGSSIRISRRREHDRLRAGRAWAAASS